MIIQKKDYIALSIPTAMLIIWIVARSLGPTAILTAISILIFMCLLLYKIDSEADRGIRMKKCKIFPATTVILAFAGVPMAMVVDQILTFSRDFHPSW